MVTVAAVTDQSPTMPGSIFLGRRALMCTHCFFFFSLNDQVNDPSASCGGCTLNDSPLIQCLGIPEAVLQSVRNSNVKLSIQPRDAYNTPTVLENGETLEISLCKGSTECTTAEANANGGTTLRAVKEDSSYSATLQATQPGMYNLSGKTMQVI